MEERKRQIDAYLESRFDDLWEISKYIHSNPEVAYEEFKACKLQVDFLRAEGFQVEENLGNLPTAYKATYSFKPGELNLAVVSEYDALPGIGHACGHNLICSSAMGTAIAIKKYLETYEVGGTVTVMGTPAEESGGGKIELLKKNSWDGIDAMLFMHPTSAPTRLAGACLSSYRIKIEFFGKVAHAGAHPENGINALNAATIYFAATGLMRQHFNSDMRLSGIIEHGGEATGLIPDYVSVLGSIACFKTSDLKVGVERIRACAEGAALATGCTAKVSLVPGYEGRVPNKTLSDVCRAELVTLEEPLLDGMPIDYGGEDIGNVSRFIPLCNPYVTIFGDYKISNHTELFKELAISDTGKHCLITTSKSLARTAIELFDKPEIVTAAKAELVERMKEQ